MSRVVKCSVAGAIKTSVPRGRQDATSSFPRWIGSLVLSAMLASARAATSFDDQFRPFVQVTARM
jgi:hypothetical protein